MLRRCNAFRLGAEGNVGPLGFEPRTKGFAWPRRFRRERTISSPAPEPGVWVRDALACHQGHFEPSGSLCTFRRCTAGSAQDCHQPLARWKVSLNSSRPPGIFQRRGTFRQKDEFPALTTELQARPESSKDPRRQAPARLHSRK